MGLAGMVLSGCGGSGGGETSGLPTLGRMQAGPYSLEGFVTGQPVQVNASGASITGLTGTFSAVDLRLNNPRAEQSLIAFNTATQIRVIDWDGGNERVVFNHTRSIRSLSWSPGGSVIYFSDSNNDLYRVSVAGGAATLMFANAGYAVVSPAGDKAAFVRSGDLYTANLDGTGAALLYDPASSSIAAIDWVVPNEIAVTFGGFTYRVYLNGSISGGSAGVLVGALRTTPNHVSSWDSSGDYRYAIGRTFPGGVSVSSLEVNAKGYAGSASSDDRFLVIAESAENESSAGTLVRRPRTLTSATTVRTAPLLFGTISAVACQRAVTARPIIGAGTAYGANASGVIWANSGMEYGGLAVLSALTPSTMRMSATEPTSTGPNVLYTVEADRITKINYTIDKGLTLSNLPVNATTNGAIVNFASSTGEVLNVLIYSVTRGEGKPKVERIGNRVRVTGNLQAAYAKGKNVLPSGASQVTIEVDGTLR